jgi:predicted nucleic acid-binding protein
VTLELLARHPRIGIDSNVLIYLLEGSGREADVAGVVLDAIAAGEGEGVMATLAVAEVASGPARQGDAAMVHRYADELASLEGVRLIAVDSEVAVEAAIVRGASRLSIGDAIHLATARRSGATAFVTNDRRITGIPGLAVVYLSDVTV